VQTTSYQCNEKVRELWAAANDRGYNSRRNGPRWPGVPDDEDGLKVEKNSVIQSENREKRTDTEEQGWSRW